MNLTIGERIAWGIYTFIATAQTVVGLVGLIFFAGVLLMRTVDRILGEEKIENE